MYSSFGSPAWIFDRCQEVSYFSWLVLALGAALAVLAGWLLVRKQLQQTSSWKNKLFLLAAPISLGLVSLPLTLITMLFVGFFVFNCYAYTQFWPGVITGHEVHAKIKEEKRKGQTPTTIEELRTLAPNLISDLETKTKFTYTYDPYQDRYTLMVRPSRYAVAVYDSQLSANGDYDLFTLSPISTFDFFQPSFPPERPGPWGNLPE